MAFTYNPTTLATTPKDQVRFLIGDVVQATPTWMSLDDAEITYLLGLYNNDVNVTAAYCAEEVLSRWARKEVGTTAHQNDQRYQQLLAVAKRLRARAAIEAIPIATGLSIADKAAADQDPDRVQPGISRGMLDTPLAPQGSEPGQSDNDAEIS